MIPYYTDGRQILQNTPFSSCKFYPLRPSSGAFAFDSAKHRRVNRQNARPPTSPEEGETVKLLVIADDLTGALDTGVQFAKAGIIPRVITDVRKGLPRSAETQVFVLNTETRHLSAADAYQRVFDIVTSALSAGFDHIYKKTDSALRGNIGSELSALMEASRETQLFFFPAYPKINRCTIGGVQYVDGIPVSDSVFGLDPFEPVRCSKIADIVALQSDIPVESVPEGSLPSPPIGHTVIETFDCSSTHSFELLARRVKPPMAAAKISAGCAGFAEFLPYIFDLTGKKDAFSLPQKDLLVCSGSLNPITIRQLDLAIHNGFGCLTIPNHDAWVSLGHPEFRRGFVQNVLNIASEHPNLILRVDKEAEECPDLPGNPACTFEQIGQQIAANIGALLSDIVNTGLDRNLIITGGDILQSFISQVGCDEVIPLGEVESGIVLSILVLKGRNITIVSKSGGFGSKDIFPKIASYFQEDRVVS